MTFKNIKERLHIGITFPFTRVLCEVLESDDMICSITNDVPLYKVTFTLDLPHFRLARYIDLTARNEYC